MEQRIFKFYPIRDIKYFHTVKYILQITQCFFLKNKIKSSNIQFTTQLSPCSFSLASSTTCYCKISTKMEHSERTESQFLTQTATTLEEEEGILTNTTIICHTFLLFSLFKIHKSAFLKTSNLKFWLLLQSRRCQVNLWHHLTDEQLPKTTKNHVNFLRKQVLFISFMFLFKTKINTVRLFLRGFSEFIYNL